jgi:hypothetical protein
MQDLRNGGNPAASQPRSFRKKKFIPDFKLILMTGYRAAIRYGPFRKATGFSEERTIAAP